MKAFLIKILLTLSLALLIGCKKENQIITKQKTPLNNTVQYAKGLEIYHHNGYSIIKITKPWPNTSKTYSYILQQKESVIPDSLKQIPIITIPIQTVVVTSTTHIPSLEMLDVEETLIGFPNTDYISSHKTQKRINAKKIKEVGNNENLNTEILINLNPDLIISYGIDDKNPSLDNLQKSGLKVILNGDWNEQTPLGKAEWIKLFGALYGLNKKADSIFTTIKKNYQSAVELAKQSTTQPTVFSGAMHNDQWFLPEGKSWAATFIKDAHGNYLWATTTGTGSLALSFETVLEKAQNANIWISPAQFTSLDQMIKNNPHYNQFSAFKNKQIYSSSTKKNAKGNITYYELSPNRPDLVLKDIIKILHPELLPNHELFFFQKLE